MTTTRLILLPRDPEQPATCLRVDARGRITGRQSLPPSHPPLAEPETRNVVVVPGEAVRALWLDLPARNPVQALAAARILLQDHVAAGEDLHVAIAGETADTPRLIAVVADAQMRDWLHRCARLGVTADAMFPDHLLLAAPDDDTLQVAAHDGRWLVRGRQLAFAAEPELARHIIGSRKHAPLDDPAETEARFAAATSRPHAEQLDLLQYAHARRRTDARRSGRNRRLAVLAALCLLSPLLLLGAQTLRHALSARWLETRADALARAQLPEPSADPSATLHARYRELAAPGLLAVQASALFDAIKRLPGARLDSLEYDSGLRAGLLHASETDLETLRRRLAAGGLDLVPLDSQTIDGGLRTQVALEHTR